MTTTANSSTKPQPVIWFGAITTFLTAVFGGLTTIAGLGDNKTLAIVCGVALLVTAAANQAKDVYVKGLVVPIKDTVAYVNEDRDVVAGPASAVPDGLPVNVTATYGTENPF